MRVRINYTVQGQEDSIIIEGETVEEIREIALREVEKRGATDPWSEVL